MAQTSASKQKHQFWLSHPLAILSVTSLFWLPLSAYAQVTSKSIINFGTGANQRIDAGTTSSQANFSFSGSIQPFGPSNPATVPYNSSGIAEVDKGIIHLDLSAFSGTIDTNITWSQLTSNITASGQWTDTLTINTLDASLLGKSGVLHGSIYRSGTDSLFTAEIASSYFDDAQSAKTITSVGGNLTDISNIQQFRHEITTGFQGHSTNNSTVPLIELIPISIGFNFGTSTTLNYSLFGEATASSRGNGKASASEDVWLYWGGISSVEVVSSSAAAQARTASITSFETVTNYSIISDSGVDYRVAMAPVPLPTTLWLFGSVVIGLIGTSRRKAA
jgi:hypothetical protein